MNILKKQSGGFTLIELLIVIGVIAALAGIVFVAVDPAKRLAQTRNTTRQKESRSILDAILLYSADHSGLPEGIDTTLRMLGTDSSDCDVLCGPSGWSGDGSFSDSSQADFNQGIYSDTQWDQTDGWLELAGG